MSLASDQVALLTEAYRSVVLDGQSFRFGERTLTQADAAWISSELDKWLARAAAERRGAGGDFAIADFSGRPHGRAFRVAD